MKCVVYSPAFSNPLHHATPHNAPYNHPLAAAASTSSTSVWSQHSDDSASSVSSGSSSDSESCDLYCFSREPTSSQTSVSSLGSSYEAPLKARAPQPAPIPQPVHVELPADLRRNPRRTSTSSTSRTGRPPTLVRQSDRKVNFVDNLVDTATHIVEAIWPTSSVAARHETSAAVLPLRTFIQETLKRSRTSYSTLQVALYYLILIKPHVPAHDFTMEQPDDCRTSQALQCGRRMYLAALILASKYLQDRNFSARAWSKISGLNTLEINQNEMAFLVAVNWELHITEEIYKRWAECVMKLTPTQPPSPGGAAQRIYERQCEDFRRVILQLTPDLDNLGDLTPWLPVQNPERFAKSSVLAYTGERLGGFGPEGESVSAAHRSLSTPVPMEPTPSTSYAAGRLAPALGLLPTPRLTPQSSGFNTPAVSAASYYLGRGSSSMGFAMAQASSVATAQSLDRWPPSVNSSPLSHFTRRSSLANSISTASSPESMVSDTSRFSRSSSISSASSSVSAPSANLDVQARFRYSKVCGDRLSMRPTIASVPEDYEENCLTASPESYTGTVGKDLCDMTLDTPLGRRQHEEDEAARALQQLHSHGINRLAAPVRAGSKRSRSLSMENSLQDNVREMLSEQFPDSGNAGWSQLLVRGRGDGFSQQVPAHPSLRASRKRICYSTEATQSYMIPSIHPAVGVLGRPGMWEGILQ